MSVSSNFLSLSSYVPSIFSQSIVPLLQQAICFSVACCRGSECSAVSSSTKGYKSATVICARQQLQGHGKTADESVCDFIRNQKLPRPDPSLPSSRRSLVHFGSAETLGWQLQAACIKKSLIHTDLIFFWILHCPKLRWCHRMPSEKSNLRDFCWNGIEDTDVFWPMNSCDFSNLSWSRINNFKIKLYINYVKKTEPSQSLEPHFWMWIDTH